MNCSNYNLRWQLSSYEVERWLMLGTNLLIVNWLNLKSSYKILVLKNSNMSLKQILFYISSL